MCQPRDISAYVHTECHSTRNAFHWKSGQYANKWSSQRCELWYDRCYVHKVCVAATITINLVEPLHFAAGVCVLNWFSQVVLGIFLGGCNCSEALINIFRLKNIAVACQKLPNAKCFTLNCCGNLLRPKMSRSFPANSMDLCIMH